MKFARAAIACLLAASPLFSQSIPGDEVRVRSRSYSLPVKTPIKVGTDLVLLRAVVRDKAGNPVSGVQLNDVEVRDRGTPQTLTIFTEESAPAATAARAPAKPGETAAPPEPRYVALYVDDANMPLSDLVPARDAAINLVKNHLRPGDLVGLFTSASNFGLDFTDDTAKILARLAELRPQQTRPDGGPGECPWINVQQAFQIAQQRDAEALNLAVEQAFVCPAYQTMNQQQDRPMVSATVQRRADVVVSMAEQLSHRTLSSLTQVVNYLGRMPGKRLLLLASSGFWTRSLRREQDRVIERAVRNDITINSLDAKGLTAGGTDFAQVMPPVLVSFPHLQYAAERFLRDQAQAYNDPLALFAQGTGGRFITNRNDLDASLASLAAPPQVSYLMGFEPQNLESDGSFHRLSVRMTPPNRAGHSIASRPGYYAPTKEEEEKRAKEDPFDEVVQSVTAIEGFPVTVTTQLEPDAATGAPSVKISVRVTVKPLPFQKRDGRHRQRLRYATAIFAKDGTFLAGSQALIELSLRDETLAKLSQDGLLESWTIRLPSGSFYLRQVVQEALEGGIYASTHPLEIASTPAPAAPSLVKPKQ